MSSTPEVRGRHAAKPATQAGPAAGTATAEPPPASRKIQGRSPWRLAFERLRKDRAAKIAAATIAAIVLLALLAPLIAQLGRPRAEPAVHRHRPGRGGQPAAAEQHLLLRHRLQRP